MGIVRLDNLADIGMVRDQHAVKLPPNAWSDSKGIAFQNGKAIRAAVDPVLLDYTQFGSIVPAPGFQPYYIASTPTAADDMWVVCGNQYAELWDRPDGVVTCMNKQSAPDTPILYTGSISNRWSSAMLHEYVVLNNGLDLPRYMKIKGRLYVQDQLADMPGWNADWRAKVIRSFKNFLIALTVRKVAGEAFTPRMVKWSHSAGGADFPSTWDETDTTKDAGEVVLGGEQDALVDCLPLEDVNVIYGVRSTWGQRLSGSYNIFNFWELFNDIGLINQGCAVRFNRQHFCVTRDDIIVHNLVQSQSVCQARVRDEFFNNLNPSQTYLITVLVERANHQIWIIYPKYPTLGYCDSALIWDWVSNTWSFLDLNKWTAAGFREYGGWTSYANIWFAQDALKNVYGYNSLYGGGSDPCYLERQYFCYVAGDNGPVYEPWREKLLKRIVPRFKSGAAAVVKFEVGVSESLEGVIAYSWSQNWTVGGGLTFLDFNVSGRFIHIKITAQDSNAWTLLGLDLDIEPLGDL